MVDVIPIFGVITGIIFLGFFAELLFKKTNIPDVLLLIFIGILLGTFLQWVDVTSFGDATAIFTTFALVFILFQGALNINIKSLISALGSTVALTVLNFILTVVAISAVAYFFLDFPILLSMLIGTILGGTSSAVVIPIVSNLHDIKEKYKLALTIESALSDVLCIIGTLTILQIMLTGEVVASGVFNSILSSFALALIVGGALGLAWMFILHKFEILKSSYMLTIASVLGVYAFVESNFVGASGAIAALTFGLILGNSRLILGAKQNSEDSISNEKNKTSKLSKDKNKKNDKENELHQETIHHSITVINTPAKNFYSEISFAVKTFFFVYLGLLIDFSNLNIFWYGALLTLAIYLVRPFAVKLVFGKEKPENFDRTVLEILIPKGLAAAVLAGVVVQSGVLEEAAATFTTMVLSVVLISIILTSILLILAKQNMFKGFFPGLGRYEEK
ncbi:MAG: cation:proton antiporter [Nanoarchaeota archaeon]|nr:cation:proton antiporter [Nanoarchaeota archaeon]